MCYLFYYLFCVFKSKKELNYDKFVDLNVLGAARHIHSDLRIYRVSFFLLDRNIQVSHSAYYVCALTSSVGIQHAFTILALQAG